jgi:glycosyltransferase involved in cell wall biosynthesis
MRSICVVTPYLPTLTETFIRNHVENLPANVVMVHGWRPSIGDRTVLSLLRLGGYKLLRTLNGADLNRETTAAYLKVFKKYNVEAVLAEYGEIGVAVLPACRRSGVPLIVHFHGYDASVHSVLAEHAETYPELVREAAAVIAVSHSMRKKLISLGAPPTKVHYNPYGVDCEKFEGADPARAPRMALAVGRFTEKKAPQHTIAAFAKVLESEPSSRLRMVGTGPLLGECQELATKLGISGAVDFLGALDHHLVQREMRAARCFVQHSVTAPSGDSEGTPVGILEAGATGLPVVSTRHAGIVDVVVEEQTGLLVNEHDVEGMAEKLLRLMRDSQLAGQMGQAARTHIAANFSREKRLGQLWGIIESCIDHSQKEFVQATSNKSILPMTPNHS